MADAKYSQPLSGQAPEEEAIERRTLRDYYIIVRERIWIALPVALIVAIGMGYQQARETPMYETRATMQFEKPETVVTTQGVVDPYIRGEADLNTALQVLGSQRLRTKVAESLAPDQVKVLQRAFTSPASPGKVERPPDNVESMLGSVSVEPGRNSYVISVIVRHPNPEAAAIVANAYINQYMRSVMEISAAKTRTRSAFSRSGRKMRKKIPRPTKNASKHT